MIRTAIIDDEPWAIELLRSYVSQIDYLELVYASEDPVKALNYIAKEKIDLVFLDMQMPEMSGADMMAIISDRAKIIVTTAFSEYAVIGFENNIVDYLLKPIAFSRFCKAVQKAAHIIPAANNEQTPVTHFKNFLFVKTDGKLIKIFLEDILFVEGLRDYISIMTTSGKIISLDSLNGMESSLAHHLFCRIHKSYIVSVNKIDSIERNRVFIAEHVLPIGETYKVKFLQLVKK